MSQGPSIKLIPNNPSISSTLIVYCYVENKNITCEAYWRRVTGSLQEQKNKQNQSRKEWLNEKNVNKGMTYKCTVLDFNHVIEVEAICNFNGKVYKLNSQSDKIRASKEILQRKKDFLLDCILGLNGMRISCKMQNEINGKFSLIIGTNKLDLKISSEKVEIISKTSFKVQLDTQIQNIMSFLMNRDEIQPKNLLRPHEFQFGFSSEVQRDMVLVQIAEKNIIKSKKASCSIQKDQHQKNKLFSKMILPVSFSVNSLNRKPSKFNQSLKPGTNVSISKQLSKSSHQIPYYFKTPDPKKTAQLILNPNNRTFNNFDEEKKQRIEENGKFYTRQEKSQSFYHKLKQKQALNQEFLNIFGEDDTEDSKKIVSSPNIPLKKPILNIKQNMQVDQHVPSINLRSSFEQLQKINFSSQNTLKQTTDEIQSSSSGNLIIFKREQIQFDSLQNGSKRQRKQTLELRRENEQLKSQLKELQKIKKENISLKKNYFKLSESLNTLEKQKREIMNEFMKLNENLSKQKSQKESILNDYRKISQLLSKNTNHDKNKVQGQINLMNSSNHHQCQINKPIQNFMTASTRSNQLLSSVNLRNNFKLNYNNKLLYQTIGPNLNSSKTYNFENIIKRQKVDHMRIKQMAFQNQIQ